MNPHDHARLLLAIVLGRWDEAESLKRGGSVSAETFLDLCAQADVSPWVHARLQEEQRAELVGPEVMQALAEIRARVRNENLLLVARANQALRVLADAGVVPVALKGLDLLHRVYPDIDRRTLDDVDLLIRPDQLKAALAALEGEGWTAPAEPKRTHYIRTSHHLPLDSPGPVVVGFEIHWNLAQEMRFAIDERQLHERARPLSIGGHQVLRMDDHDLVAHLLLHQFSHYFDRRLKWAVDIEAIASQPGFDWEVAIDRVCSWDAAAVVGLALEHLHKMVPEWIPERSVSRLRPAAWRRAVTWPLRSTHPMELFRGTRRRWVQLYLATVLLENPWLTPRWLLHRATRGRKESTNPLDT
jgi:hypothetical protein